MPAASAFGVGPSRCVTSTLATANAAPNDKQNRFVMMCLMLIACPPPSTNCAIRIRHGRGCQWSKPASKRCDGVIKQAEPTQLAVFVPTELIQLEPPTNAMQHECR